MTTENDAARAGKTQRKTRIQREKESVILEAALDLFSAQGYVGTTVDQIAAAAGMSKPNLLYYFGRKEDVYVALLDRQIDDWTQPLEAIRADGDPIAELRGYIRRKLEMSRLRPRESRLYANEILQGAPRIQDELHGQLHALVAEKAAIIKGWVDARQIGAVDATHLIFAIWATTQHYADFDAQVRAITRTEDDAHFDAALKTLETIFLDGLRIR